MSEPTQTKAQMKAARRALQEAQREAKAGGTKLPKAPPSKAPAPTPSKKPESVPKQKSGEMALPSEDSLCRRMSGAGLGQHPAFAGLDAAGDTDQLATGLLGATAEFIRQFPVAKGQADWARAVDGGLANELQSLTLPPPLENWRRQLRAHVSQLEPSLPAEKAKKELLEWVSDWKTDNLDAAHDTISVYTREKLPANAHVITYSWSALVQRILVEAAADGRALSVTVLDSFPEQRGLRLLRALADAGVSVAYAPLTAAASLLPESSLVLLGAEAVLGDGSAVVEVGSALVALAAAHHNIPLLLPCPTYKFVEKVGKGSLASFGPRREVVAAGLVSGVVTELRLLPATAASAVFRVKTAL